MVPLIPEHQRVLAHSFRFIEEAHKGALRLRTELPADKNGFSRSYDHHPLEVAFIFAEMEVFTRQNKDKKLTPIAIADKIVETVDRAAHMSKRELKSQLFAIAQHLTEKELTTVVGLLCHDTIESSYKRNAPEHIKVARTTERYRQIRDLRKGAELIAIRMTDSKHHKNKKEKRTRQLALAKSKPYARLKIYDILPNMYDEALIPNNKRSRAKKRYMLNHMRCFVRIAHRHKHIALSYLMASERIYERSMAQLG